MSHNSTHCRKSAAFGICLLTILVAIVAQASAAPSVIAPFVDDTTIAVIRINVAPLDLDAYSAWMKDMDEAMALPQTDIDHATQATHAQGAMANEWIGKFNKAGGKTLYAVVAMGSPPAVKLVVPLEGGADGKALGELLAPPHPATSGPASPMAMLLSDAKAQVIGKTLYVGSPQAMLGLKDFEPAARPELEAAFASCGNAALAIAMNPNEGLRGMAVMAMPQLPKEVGGGPTATLSQGLRWLSLSYDLPPKPALHLTIQAKDAAAAARLHGIVDDALKSFKTEMAANAPGLDTTLAAITPAVAGDQLRLDVDSQKFTSIAKAVGPALVRARGTATHVQSANNLRQLALGVMMYANDHTGDLPKNPKEDLKSYLGPASDALWINPTYPDRKEGYYYLRSADKLAAIDNPSETPMFYESFGTWKDGYNVAFADGHVEAIKDEAAFKKMLAKAQGKH